MIYEVSNLAVIIFLFIVGVVLGLSFYFARKTKSSSGYYAAGGNIHWSVNGIAFAGDYLSAASFLGICGMIAFSGYDGFLYSIGYLAGWVVALFLVAEPLKKLGKYTFTDALDSKFNSKSIKLAASISTLIVSIFYLIPQMVGAGDLVVPLLGLPHWMGVLIVGSIVIFIVATAGMTSTTYVQFIKGGLLVLFSLFLTIYILNNGLSLIPHSEYHKFDLIPASVTNDSVTATETGVVIKSVKKSDKLTFVKLEKNGNAGWYKLNKDSEKYVLEEMLYTTELPNGEKLYNGAPKSEGKFYQVGHLSKIIVDGNEVDKTGPVGPFEFIKTIENSEVVRFSKKSFSHENEKVTVWYQNITKGKDIMKPGLLYKLSDAAGATLWDKLNFVSLMLALFLGTSALPHILIRYYTVPSQRAARKSTIVAITAIGFFYILTLYMGLGSMIGGVLDVESSNMSGPLLAKSFGIGLFSIISAIAFATVLGTVSGLIVASSGAIAHDFIDKYLRVKMNDKAKVKAGKIAAVCVGIFAIILGILFKGMNVSFLVGLAFAVAASANLPAILFLLFWKKTTAKGIAWSIIAGIISSIGIILVSPTMYDKYGLAPKDALIQLDNPGIVSIPLAILTLVIVSLMTQKDNSAKKISAWPIYFNRQTNMKITILSLLIISSISIFAQDKKEESKFSVSISGFVKTDVFYDTRQTISIREGHFLLYPDNVSLDAGNTDINAAHNFNILSIQSRLKVGVTGPEIIGAKPSGVIEADFFGNENASFSDVNGFRLRHAFVKLNWPSTELLAGQYWHPMFIAESFPGVLSFNTGAPFQPFSRNPQVRLTKTFGRLKLIGCLFTQRDFTGIGPEYTYSNNKYTATALASSKFLRNSGIPNMHFQMQYKSDSSNFLAGAGIDYKIIKPELYTVNNAATNKYKSETTLGSLSAIGFLNIKLKPVSIKLEGIYAQNAYDLVMIGGYGIKEITDTATGKKVFTNLNTLSMWADFQTAGEKFQGGLFCGYTKNMGSRDSVKGSIYARGSNIDYVYRVAPRLMYIAGKLNIGIEGEYTFVMYGKPNGDFKGGVTNGNAVYNTRALLAIIYNF